MSLRFKNGLRVFVFSEQIDRGTEGLIHRVSEVRRKGLINPVADFYDFS